MAVLVFGITMIYLTISISAALTNDQESYFILRSANGTSSTAWTKITTPQTVFIYSGGATPNTTTNYDLYVAYKTNHIITDGDIIVMVLALQGTTGNEAVAGVGQLVTGTMIGDYFSESYLTSKMETSQTIIATTFEDITSDTTRITVTFRASGFTNLYPFIKVKNVKREGTSIKLTEIDLYDTVEDAAGSGTTPEEMRAVLEAWTEETLLPGMENSVSNGVQSGMEAALEDEKNEANSSAQSGLDELTGALNGVTEDITQAKQTFETLGSALSYSGTSASMTFPAMTVPFLGTISEAQPINLTEQIDNIMPPTLLLIIRCALSIGIVSYPIIELITQLRKLLDKG